MIPTRFSELSDLARLPWFDFEGGRLVLDPAIGPVIDVHTHLSLSFLLPSRVDQERTTEPVRSYLPERGRAIDLELYMNKNLSRVDRWRMKADLIAGSFLPGGPRVTHTAANLLRRMADMRVSHSVILAIDLPYISRNSEIYLDVSRRHPALVPFGSVHPRGHDPVGRVRALARQGARGIKVHPSSQAIYPNDPGLGPIYRTCGELGLPVLWHCGPVGIEPERVRRYSLVRHYEEPIRSFPEVTFLLGHSGALQFPEAIVLARRYPNVMMDLSCQGLDGVRAVLEGVDPDRITNGSDWPFYHPAPGIARVLLATDGDADLRRKVLHDNVARLLSFPRPAA